MITVPQNIRNTTGSNDTAPEYKNSDSLSRASWLSHLLNYVPGYSWMKIKLGRMIFGPTFGLTETELRAFLLSEQHQYQVESLQKEREAEFKAARYMAVVHPEWYWYQYIHAFPKGSEERKRAVFLFFLANKQMYGSSHRGNAQFAEWLDREFREMRGEFDGDQDEDELEHERLQKRSREELWQDVSEENSWIFNDIEKAVQKYNIHSLIRAKEYQKQWGGRKKREFVLTD